MRLPHEILGTITMILTTLVTPSFTKIDIGAIIGAATDNKPSNTNPPTFQVSFTQKSFDFRNVSSWSGGGGPFLNITNDSGHPFAGRQFGGGIRRDIKGTRAFGSGYPYGKDNSSTIAGRPFPYGVWPLYWGDNIMGSDEYGAHLDAIRPGGPLVIQSVAPSKQGNVTIEEETYYMITDKKTAFAMMTSFVTWCHAAPSWPTIYQPGNPTNTVGIYNVLQYYRASSFAWAYKGYNNTFALTTTTDAGYNQSSPLPDVVAYSSFEQCIEGVIANAIPIIDRAPKKLNKGALAGKIVGGLIGAIFLSIVLAFIKASILVSLPKDIRKVAERSM